MADFHGGDWLVSLHIYLDIRSELLRKLWY